MGLKDHRNPFTRTKLPEKLFEDAQERYEILTRFKQEKEENIDPRTVAYSILWDQLKGYPIDQSRYDQFNNEQLMKLFNLVKNNTITRFSNQALSEIERSKDKHLALVNFFNGLLRNSRDKDTDSLLIVQSMNEVLEE